jgi:16S rRNA (guanine(966)-N(2))-methyltransferase RsmD
VKEALFNILRHDLTGFEVLDLFAGTGNLAIEALSRGAARALLVDASPAAAKAMQENLRRLGLTERAKVRTSPVNRALRILARRREAFDIIFLDPPYDQRLAEATLKLIARENLLRDEGMVIAEHSVREPVAAHYGFLALHDQRRYGGTLLSFFKVAAEDQNSAKGNHDHGA